MIILSQLKLTLLVLAIVGVAGLGVLLTPQTGSPGNEPVSASATDQWEELDDSQRDLLTKRHLQAIARAVHAYVDDHNGMLPPAAVPNPNLPLEKRLSGMVLLLPYLGVRPSYIAEDDADWIAWHADNQRAKQIFGQIELTKAWDDPANAKAARSIVPEFLAPDNAEYRDREGYAVSHFAFVRGSRERDNGMFPLTDQPQLAIPDINDGTSSTLAIGQVHDDTGPWIAAGPPTARFISPASVSARTPGFGSQYAGAAWFANGDSFTYFFDLSATDPQVLDAIAGRDDGEMIDDNRLARFASAKEWMESKAKKGANQ